MSNNTLNFQLKIEFKHDFRKIHRQTKARLVFMTVVDADSLHPDFKEYETLYFNGSFNPKYFCTPSAGKVILLYFVGDKMIPFCAARPYSHNKESFFRNQMGRIFQIRCKQKSFLLSSVTKKPDNPDVCFFKNPYGGCNCSHEHVASCANPKKCRSFLPDIEEIRSVMSPDS
jgi:hypothetical protein